MSGFNNYDLTQQLGIIIWNASEYVSTGDDNYIYTSKGATIDGSRYAIRSHGICVKNIVDQLKVVFYLEVAEGEYIYSNVVQYSPSTYAYNALKSSSAPADIKNLCKALLNFASASQITLNYEVDDLANKNLSETDKAMDGILAWSDDYLTEIDPVDVSLASGLAKNESVFTRVNKTVSICDAMQINFKYTIAGNYAEYGVMFWSASDYQKLLSAGQALSMDNASIKCDMTIDAQGRYVGVYEGIVAKAMGEAVYACAYVVDAAGNIYYSGVEAYSVETYAANAINSSSAPSNVKETCKWMVIYGEMAQKVFN